VAFSAYTAGVQESTRRGAERLGKQLVRLRQAAVTEGLGVKVGALMPKIFILRVTGPFALLIAVF